MKKLIFSLLMATSATSYSNSSNIIPLHKLMFHSLVAENAHQKLSIDYPEYAQWLNDSDALLLLNFINTTDKTVIIKFSADWCGPCKRLKPIIQQAAQECLDTVVIIEVNIDENPNIREMFDVQAVPTLIYFKNGQQVDQTHSLSKESLIDKINTLIDQKSNPTSD